ncbi:MerR family transcriptional regulator [Streptomyces tropicalis]|uniref:MerR family transcriptional regulator n=1 Tax=Streptomyces tropicalis TaxID=3034234 RepID=A0ABT6A421_9ACTN|nr:MerR family transcriptional regulator [Streptomyces tropicalis]MDF3299223.1 MerR family transcriptional regulator [Streptomyces tropicalis]
MAAAPGVGVTTGLLARRLGVSPTTLRSWDRRYGLGPAARADGRHRRWTPDDVAMMQEMCRLTASGVPPAEAARAAREFAEARTAGDAGPAVPEVPAGTAGPVDGTARAATGTSGTVAVAAATVAGAEGTPPGGGRTPAGAEGTSAGAEGVAARDAAPSDPPRAGRPAGAVPADGTGRPGGGTPPGDVRQECRGLARAAVRLDGAAVQEQVMAAVRAYGLVAAWEEVLAPALRAVGRKWQSSDDRYVEVEHLLSWHVSATLRQVYVRSALEGHPADAGPVVLAGLPGEYHTLPIEALCAALAERGVPVLMLGGAVPAEALVATVERVGPAAVALWSQSRSTASLALASHVAAIRWGVRGARRQSRVLLLGPGWDRGVRAAGLGHPRDLREALTALCADGSAPAGPRLG